MSTAVETVKHLTAKAQEVIRDITRPITENDAAWALSERPDLVRLPSGPLGIQISVPEDYVKDLPEPCNNATQHPSASLNLPTILFMHGLGCNSTIWNPLIRHAKLRNHFRIVTYDMPGCGLSPFGTFIGVTPEGDPSERMAKDDQIFREVREYMGMGGDTHVIAHSMGCRALERYLMNEDHVEFENISECGLSLPIEALPISSLPYRRPEHRVPQIMISPNVPQNSTTTLDETGLTITSMLFEQGLPLLQTLFREYGFSSYSKEHRPLAVDFVDAMSTLPTNRLILLQWLALFHPPLDRSEILRKATEGKFGLMVLQGAEDNLVVPAAREELEQSYGACSAVRYETLKNVGHWSMLEDYESVTERLKEVLAF